LSVVAQEPYPQFRTLLSSSELYCSFQDFIVIAQLTVRLVAAVGEFADEGEERHVHGDDDGADGDAEEADHERLHQGQQVGDGRIDLLLVEVGDLAEHRVELARLLADADHLRDHVREDLGRLQRVNEALAALDPRANPHDRLLDPNVARRLGRDLQGLQDRHARGEQRRERAREARDGDLLEHLPEDGRLEQQPVEGAPPARRLVVGADADDREDDADEDRQAAPARDEVAHGDDDARRQRQLLAGAEQPLEDRLELRDDEDHDRRDDEDGDADDGRRVDERRDHVAPQLDQLLDEGREALEDEVEDAARLARLDHVDEELIEDLRVAAHGGGQRRALLHVLPRLAEGLREELVVLLLREDFQTLDEREARVDHHGELAREDRQLLGLDLAALGELGDGHLAPLLLDGGEHHLLAPQELAQRLAVVGHALADHHLAEPVAAFENVCGHLRTPRGQRLGVRG
jgi:hypothetical protein